MVLTQLKIAPAIVTATYVALIGMLALAGALAFGLGGRDIAHDLLSNAYDSAQDNQDQVKRDMRTGRDRAKQQAEEVKQETQSGNSAGAAPAGRPRI
jgi:hypothetical protein